MVRRKYPILNCLVRYHFYFILALRRCSHNQKLDAFQIWPFQSNFLIFLKKLFSQIAQMRSIYDYSRKYHSYFVVDLGLTRDDFRKLVSLLKDLQRGHPDHAKFIYGLNILIHNFTKIWLIKVIYLNINWLSQLGSIFF